ncbi:glycosyltransferase family 4 protein [Streptacidiphilus sp. ASG 303]|uniref:glycosyltransferase family 4 protein n=1 Tax=Streptacidiphilus sp. ASG 303 TaxID=2896847 RepID=UPI001E61A603|nr:glycosyltransferase family 4 protein [Streptacidiphilus sp. ASG 303]MCD0480874.1 glycosyltransferase family 4 protein [Streptacidiphilus sp. ASG 303]
MPDASAAAVRPVPPGRLPAPARPAPAPAADPDPLAALRARFYRPAAAPAPRRADGCEGPLLRLARPEYEAPEDPRDTPDASDDAAAARVRRACRTRRPLHPAELAAHLQGPPPLRTAAAEAWPAALAAHGSHAGAAALRRRLLAGPGPGAAEALDLADAWRLRPLGPAEARLLAPAQGGTPADRALRHAVWRYLSGLPAGAAHLPDPALHEDDPYERLLLAAAACRRAARPGAPGSALRTALPAAPPPAGGAVVAQSMLLGRLDTPGQGLSGGLSVLLSSLGDTLARTPGIGLALTLVAADRTALAADPVLLRTAAEPGHRVLRLPVDTDGPLVQEAMPEHRAALAWWAEQLLGLAGAVPDVVHVRYADDGSLAVAEAARRLGSRVVFTATPDPHRFLAARHGRAADSDPQAAAALRQDLHRVFAADRLVERADAVVGIGGRAGGPEELLRYFPQLADGHRGRLPASPPEGIAPHRPAPGDAEEQRTLLARLYAGGLAPECLDPQARGLPLLLSVGRLHPVKQQHLLVEAWLAAGLHRRTALVLVGGAAERPSEAESAMRRRIADLLEAVPGARRRCALLPALPNRSVRLLERALASPARPAPAVYVCPSAKEEFGLAVLEAMDAGLAAAGPLRGGVPHYLRHGANGWLLDTSSVRTLADGLEDLLALPAARLRALAEEGRRTVRRDYSITAMADRLAEEYLRLAEESREAVS